jgi:hypothetical protein
MTRSRIWLLSGKPDGQVILPGIAALQSIMKECHPDRTNEEANEFCALLNEIYEVRGGHLDRC